MAEKEGALGDRDPLQRTLLRYRRRGHGSPPHPRPGLPFDKLRAGLEAVYQAALAHELTLRGIRFEQFKRLPVYYKDVLVGDYEADFVVEDKIIPSTSSGQRLEIKAVSTLHPKHEAQAHHYLTATGLRLAILLNFGTDSLQHQRIVK